MSVPTGAPAERGEAVVEIDRAVRCAACGHALAKARDRMEVNGTSAHVFVNPSAIEFTIVCYRDAAGAAAVGERSTYWSWFPGHAWQVAICARCATHVGWWFFGAESRFVGLIVDRVVEE